MPDRAADDRVDVLGMIREAAGETAMLRVAYHFGGGEVYIPHPRNLQAEHRLVRALGRDLAHILFDLFGIGPLLIPLGPMRQSTSSRIEIPQELAHRSAGEIARAIGCHVRTIHRQRARERRGGGD